MAGESRTAWHWYRRQFAVRDFRSCM